MPPQLQVARVLGMIGQGLRPFSVAWSGREVDTCCLGDLFHGPAGLCAQGLMWSLPRPMWGAVLLGVELIGRSLWERRPLSHPSPKRRFPNLDIPV